MSYEVIYTPPKEVMETYNNCFEDLKYYKHYLLYYCMTGITKELSAENLYSTLKMYLNAWSANILLITKKNAYNVWKEDEDNQLWFSGWQYSQPQDEDKEEILNEALERLYILATAVPTPDYFVDQEKFYDKVAAIKSELEMFYENLVDCYRFDIMKELEQYKLKDEE